MNITFKPLGETDFTLLLKWLRSPHVKVGWDHDIQWTLALIEKKYADYVKGYKLEDGVAKAISAYIIYIDTTPIGYIQIYNAYDFARSKPLTQLPLRLAAVDVLIGEENYLKQGIGSKAIVQFLNEQGDAYTHIFVDPQSNNLAAIRAYEKAGFKKIKVHVDTGEVWMIREQTQRPDPLHTIQKLIAERYLDAKAVFWAGSVSRNQGTSASDLDLIIVFDVVDHAYREAFIYDKWPIDAFIHDTDTLRYFFEESRAGKGISGTISMILNGQELIEPSNFSKNIKTLAQAVLKAGPAAWDQQQIDKERFLITDALDDIKCPASRDEQIASAAWLFEALGQFYFRSQNKWCASGKSIIRYLKNDRPYLAKEFTQCFESLFQTGNAVNLVALVKKILAPYGGLLWDGFKSDALKTSRIAEPCALSRLIQPLEQSLLDPSVRLSSEQVNKLIADDFFEFGSSGKIYNKQHSLEPEEYARKGVMNIHFEKANLSHVPTIFNWLLQPYIQEFWDNTPDHKNDILNFVHGRKEPSAYCDGKYVYWIASCEGHPFAMLMTIQETTTDPINDIKLMHLSKTGHTYSIDYMIGDKNYLGKGYGSKTLIDFLNFFIKEFDPTADTFLIDPASNNPRAKYVYLKAGFEHIADFVMSGDVSAAGKPHHLLIRRFGPKIRLLPATLTDYPTIQNMARFYVYDRTAYMGWACPENGLFECIDFRHYFETPDEKAFLIRVDNEIAGFVLLDKIPLLAPVDWNMGEFFILAKFQGKGIARTIAQQIFQAHPGKWTVAVMPENIRAVKFWCKMIADISREKYTAVFKTEDELRTAENPDPYAMNIFSFEIQKTS